MEFIFANYDFICKNLSAKMKINAEPYIKTYNFQKTRTNNGYDFQKFIPQNAMFWGYWIAKKNSAKICSAKKIFSWGNLCCPFLYAGTWELVNLFVETNIFNYHICYENIGRSKILKSQETDRKDRQNWTMC